MPRQERNRVRGYKGVYYILGTDPKGREERIYYIAYRNRQGKLIEEKAGRAGKDKMTAGKAAAIRARRIQGDEPTNVERRKAKRAAEEAEAKRWTVNRLWEEYARHRYGDEPDATDRVNYEKHISSLFAGKEPKDILPLDVDRLRLTLSKKLKPGTVAKVLGLLRRIILFGTKKGLCPPLAFKIALPRVSDEKTEYLTDQQIARLVVVLDEHPDQQIANLVRMAMLTGMRRGELFNLKWEDVDLERGFLRIRQPKGGTDATIPLSDAARGVLESHPRTSSPYIFPGRGGGKRRDAKTAMRKIRKDADLPGDFRPFHGLRHTYASHLASSGKVDLYFLQKLLTHKSPRMTARYAHLRDEALRQAANVADELVKDTAKRGKR